MTYPAALETFPASFAQTRLWFLDQLDSGLDAYHISLLWSVQGPLNYRALQHALDQLLIRHESLRTSFQFEDGQVLQRIHPPASFPLCQVTLIVEDDPDDRIREESLASFDLSQGTLIRALLIKRSAEEHLLLITIHHIASDAWSLSLLQQELSAFYNSSLLGATPDLPILPIQYADFSVWQRQQLSGERREQLLGYWRKQLEDLEPLELPTDHPRPALPSYRGDSLIFDLDAARTAGLESLCQQNGATLQMGLLTLVGVLLQRYSRSDDIPIGVPHWGRNHPDLEGLVGYFVNILVLRCDLSGGPNFLELLRRVRNTSLEAYEHQDLPFEEVVEALRPERDRSRHPLVQVVVQLLDLPKSSLSLTGLTVQPLRRRTQRVRFDLEFFFRRQEQGLQVSIIYSTDLFDSERIGRLKGHLVRLLDGVLADANQPIQTLPLLTPTETELLERWSQGPDLAVPTLCVHQLFEQQVERTPEAIALVFQDQQLTYDQLNRRANRLAHGLIRRGVGPEVIVAVCLERSIEMVVALLAILKAGGAYLPLDPAWPTERLTLLLHEARPSVVLTASGDAQRLGPDQGSACLRLDDPALELAGQPDHDPCSSGHSVRQLAYLTFTSGSTGLPKGVLIEHRSILRLLDPANPFQITRDDTVLQLAPLAFDAATFEIWGALLSGATLVVAPPGALGLARLAALLQQQRISTLWLTAGLFHAMVEEQPEALSGVRQLLAGGDVLSARTTQTLLDTLPPGHQLINGYGPTEGTTFTSCHAMPGGTALQAQEVPIGRPIAGTTVRVLDGHGQPSPIGIPGELHIGGVGLARGYQNNPELTAETFIPDPCSADPTTRLYKSGDLAAWNPDGTLAFCGRLDQQFKLRGFRIEPGEIEAHLLAHPAVGRAVVLLRHDDPANPRLIAYWVPQVPDQGNDASTTGSTSNTAPTTTAPTTAAELRSFLAERLPDYMVPAAFMELGALPLTTNGKLDRKALPAPSFSGDLQQRVAPTTALQLKLHALWAEVLGHADFGITDNFFLMGGHSLAAARLVTRIQEVIGLDLPVASVFRWPTIAEQAAWLSREGGPERGAACIADQGAGADLGNLVTLQPLGERTPLFAIHGWGGCVGGFINLARALAPHRPVLGLQAAIPGKDAPDLPSVREMAARYAEQILMRQPDGPIHLLGYSAGGWYAHAVAAALLERGATIGMFAVFDTHATTRIHRRLGLALLARQPVPRLKPHLQRILRAPTGERWRRSVLDLIKAVILNVDRHLHLRLSRPGRLLATLVSRDHPALADGGGDPFVNLLLRGDRPVRLPLVVDVFAPPRNIPNLQRLWSFYARRGVRSHPMFQDHFDFYKAELMPELAEALEIVLQRVERGWDQSSSPRVTSR